MDSNKIQEARLYYQDDLGGARLDLDDTLVALGIPVEENLPFQDSMSADKDVSQDWKDIADDYAEIACRMREDVGLSFNANQACFANGYNDIPQGAVYIFANALAEQTISVLVERNDIPDRLRQLLLGDAKSYFLRGWSQPT